LFYRKNNTKNKSNRNEESIEMLRRFQSEPVLANPRLESSNYKIKSDLRQSILHRHRHVTPMSDKRHPIRSTTLAQKQQHATSRPREIIFDQNRCDGGLFF
jgi:hypothetical protein